MLVDTHCHLDFPEFNADRPQVIQRAKNQGIGYIINIGSSLEGSKKSIALSQEYDFVFATVGIHPHEADRFNEQEEISLKGLVTSKKVVAVGEIGLDYYKNYSKAENQRALFQALLRIAKESNLPVVIHSRQACIDTLKIIKESMPLAAVMHCFSEDEDFLKACLDLGFFISFTCNITYKKADRLKGVVKAMPLERLLLETDAPFLPPEGFRGRRNEPAYVMHLAKEIARIKGESLEEIARVTTDNARKFFNLP